MSAKQWKKAAMAVDTLQPIDKGKPYFFKLAKSFDDAKEVELSGKYYVLANKPHEAVDMYLRNNQWERAHELAKTFMNDNDISSLYVSRARDLEAAGIYILLNFLGKLKEAENVYLIMGEPDLAINMYKNFKQYDQMIRLVTAYHKDLLVETHVFLGKALEIEGNIKQAEYHYLEGKEWKTAINMVY